MDEIIVRLARAIASLPRLRMVSLLVREGELTPTRLAKDLRLPLNVVSLHLRVLTVAGLICRRKAGAWCHYRAESPYDSTAPSGRLTAWLCILLQASSDTSKEDSGLHEVRNLSSNPEEALRRVIFEAATAFTDLRRLQVLRFLGRQREAKANDLVEVLSISPQAVGRHMGKLIRRGYVRTQRCSRTVVYTLAPVAKTPVHKRMLEIVQAAWEQQRFRTS